MGSKDDPGTGVTVDEALGKALSHAGGTVLWLHWSGIGWRFLIFDLYGVPKVPNSSPLCLRVEACCSQKPRGHTTSKLFNDMQNYQECLAK